MQQLQKSIVHINVVQQYVTLFNNKLVQTVNTHKVMEYYENDMLFDLLNTDVLAKKVLQNYAETVDDRAKVFPFLSQLIVYNITDETMEVN